MPTLNEAREAIGSTLRTNLFDITFDVLPGFTDSLRETLSFLACRASIPGIKREIGFGSNGEVWVVSFLMPNLDIYDAFMHWYREDEDRKGAATINTYNLDGSIDRKYKIEGLLVEEISSIELEWEPATEPAKLQVSFLFDSCEKVGEEEDED
jgi:hypothetical protein